MRIKVGRELLHTHPWDECKHGLDKDHVIVDKAAFVAALKEIQDLRAKLLESTQ